MNKDDEIMALAIKHNVDGCLSHNIRLLAFANACEKIGVEEAEERAAILQDSAYVAGMKFGWNCCCNDNSAAFEKAIEDRINERVQLRAHKE